LNSKYLKLNQILQINLMNFIDLIQTDFIYTFTLSIILSNSEIFEKYSSILVIQIYQHKKTISHSISYPNSSINPIITCIQNSRNKSKIILIRVSRQYLIHLIPRNSVLIFQHFHFIFCHIPSPIRIFHFPISISLY
jgi:hypothetical protein